VRCEEKKKKANARFVGRKRCWDAAKMLTGFLKTPPIGRNQATLLIHNRAPLLFNK